MKISHSWLREYYPNNISVEETAALLTDSGLEVESVDAFESVPGGLKGLVIGQVKTCEKHPNADKLTLTTVDTSSGIHSIVCGAPNVAVGQKVVVALPGTTLYPVGGEPFTIKESKIRGEVSQGMICAEDEIGLGASHAGIIVLPDDAIIGMPAADYYKVSSDTVFEIGLTPNRADAASHIGVARDLAAVVRTNKWINEKTDEKIDLVIPTPERKIKEIKSIKQIKVQVEDAAACPRYSGITLINVKVGESPDWLKNRLLSIGLHPINNIVDITNYVLHECGQPLHAFDADKISGGTIVVRKATQGEKFITLDKVERSLHADDLMICDEKEPMCIAGVFGGVHSGITESTKSVFIESAYFDPSSIRKTSKRHGLKTDASFRFERGTDPGMTLYALRRAASLMVEIAGAQVSSEISDFYPAPMKPASVNLSFNYLDTFSGSKLDRKTIQIILDALGIKVQSSDNDVLRLEVPLFKVDVHRPADVVEEILRVYGYDRIPLPAKMNISMPTVHESQLELLVNKIGKFLSANGFLEMLNNSLTKSEYSNLPGWSEVAAVNILNPLSAELSVLRQDMLYTALETVSYNVNRKQEDLRLFETGKAYHKDGSSYKESYRLCMLLTGSRGEANWKQKETEVDFYYFKSYVERVLELCGVDQFQSDSISEGSLSSGLRLSMKGDELVSYGSVQKSVLKKFDLAKPVLYAEFNLDNLLKHRKKSVLKFKEISKFPPVRRDLSMLIGKDISYASLEQIAYKAGKKLLRDIRLFDVYEGEKIGAGKKSYAMTFILQDDEQTLTEQQINKVMDGLMKAFEKEAGAEIRKS